MKSRHTCKYVARVVILSLVSAVLLLGPHATRAENPALKGLNPHIIADASSPRDTLRSFMTLSREMIETWRANGSRDRIYILLKGLSETLDYSATEDGARIYVQIRRILLLREVLDRIALPPWSEIPGREEVAAQNIEVWTIPGTRLRLKRVVEGAYAGDYLFSAGTV